MTPPPPGPPSEAELHRLLAALRAHNNSEVKKSSRSSSRGAAVDGTAVVVARAAAPSAAAAAAAPRPPRRVEGARVELPNGDVYEGDVVVTEGSSPPIHLHGRGTYTASDGARYEGGYRWGAREGQGEFWAAASAPSSASASAPPNPPVSVRYRGPWVADSPHGAGGEAWYSDGAHYSGDWAKGKRDGWGLLSRPAAAAALAGAGAGATTTKEQEGATTASSASTASTVVVYEGEWRDEAPHGRGRWTFEDGSGFFEGVFARGVRVEGRLVAFSPPAPSSGPATAAAAAVVDFDYTGPLHPEDGSRHGDDGACSCPGRWEYRGPWRRGQRHSGDSNRARLGVCRWPDGSRYEGPWADDQPHGDDGTWTEANGDVYRGGFVQGKREGRGAWRSVAGEERYTGGWRSGEREGQGECRYADGGRYFGGWRAGRRHGLGRMRFADGAVFEGAWEEDAWVQGAADPRFCRLRGLRRAIVATPDGPGPAPGGFGAFGGGGGGDDAEGEEASTSSSPGWFVIAARDELGNARLSGGDAFSVVVEGPLLRRRRGRRTPPPGREEEEEAEGKEQQMRLEDDDNNNNNEARSANVLDAGDGTYRVRLPPGVLRRAGAYRVHVTDALSGQVVAGAPLALEVLPGPPDARRCRVAVPRPAPPVLSSSWRVPLGGPIEARVGALDALGNPARASAAAAGWAVEAALVWRGPLAQRRRPGGGGSGAAPVVAAAVASSATTDASVVVPLSVTAVAEDDDGTGGGWVVRGRAPAVLPCGGGGEFLLEVVAVGAKGGRTHLPGSPLLVVVGGPSPQEEEEEEEQGPTPTVRDEARAWAARAAAAAAAEGDGEGAKEEAKSRGGGGGDSSTAAERAFVAANPLVPVVENLRDLHLVSRVQAMREEEGKRAAERRAVKGRR